MGARTRSPSWDVFCRVIDNYGDAAVCWRLARQLAGEHGLDVRLWADNLAALRMLNPAVDAGASRQQVEGVEIGRWEDAQTAAAADVVIEAFGCKLPEGYMHAMASAGSLWITLEYLSAEPWVGAHHGLPSPHPQLPLQRYFYFPGFDAASGGLLREQALFGSRDALQQDPALQARLWRALGCEPPAAGTRTLSLFGYENSAAPALLNCWAEGQDAVLALVPASRLRFQVESFFGETAVADGSSLRRGRLEARFLPFMPQPRYDELLWLCDWNFVRGEDSFVRAQWAARPLVWQIYPQEQGAHWAKLNAFVDRYVAALDDEPASALRALWQAWNGGPAGPLAKAWEAVSRSENELSAHALAWAGRMAALGDLAGNLLRFCEGKRVK
jgi:uncharacterized repeat protein (TIGR03837 family)